VPTLLACLTGVHHACLSGLDSWAQFRSGWTKRLLDAREQAMELHG
jgi:hypothetical protein